MFSHSFTPKSLMVSKKKGKKVKAPNNNPTELDARFVAAVTRPQFRKQKVDETKIVLDDRFSSILTDPKFRLETKDKYGRRTKKKEDIASDLKEFYVIRKKEDEKAHQIDEEKDDERLSDDHSESSVNSEHTNDPQGDDADKDNDPASRIAYLTALSRGELDLSESSDDNSESESEDDEIASDSEASVRGKAGILDPSSKAAEDIPITHTPSPYIAVMNMDWDHVRAVDIFAILSSFSNPGSVLWVKVYPSNYGLERMEKEKIKGPIGVWKESNNKLDELNEESTDEVDDDESVHVNDNKTAHGIKFEVDNEDFDSSFDPEKLRAYEASKLRYYFAIVQFASPEISDAIYKEVDELELEHSSASIDLRSIDPEELSNVTHNRQVRDEAFHVPSNYKPPEFVVNALQQTNVRCTWDEGDIDREQKLTKYASGQGWSELAESEDLRAYIASDNSSNDDSDMDTKSNGKGSKLRKLLGLDSDDDGAIGSKDHDDDESENSEDGGNKEITFVPGKESLEERIRLKVQNDARELTPWEKLLEKRRQKKREKRQASRRDKLDEAEEGSLEEEANAKDVDDFLLGGGDTTEKSENKVTKKKSKRKKNEKSSDSDIVRLPSTKEELQLLAAGDNDDEDEKDYDIRGLIQMDKMKDRKLKGARKRKQEKLAANVSGQDFKIDTSDSRFSAVFTGDNGQFGIDRTDPNFRETEAMRQILDMQTKNRKARKRSKAEMVTPNVNADMTEGKSAGGKMLSSLVSSIKAKIAASSANNGK
jgi:NUC153 domain